jgi:hypothetical protein
MDYQVDISVYPTKNIALRYCRELAFLTSSQCTSSARSLLAHWTLRIGFISVSFQFRFYFSKGRDDVNRPTIGMNPTSMSGGHFFFILGIS